MGRAINLARFYREKSDYVDYYIVSKQETKTQIETAKTLSEYVEKYINEYF